MGRGYRAQLNSRAQMNSMFTTGRAELASPDLGFPLLQLTPRCKQEKSWRFYFDVASLAEYVPPGHSCALRHSERRPVLCEVPIYLSI